MTDFWQQDAYAAMTVIDKRRVFVTMHGQAEIDLETPLPNGLTLSEFAVMHILGEQPRGGDRTRHSAYYTQTPPENRIISADMVRAPPLSAVSGMTVQQVRLALNEMRAMSRLADMLALDVSAHLPAANERMDVFAAKFVYGHHLRRYVRMQARQEIPAAEPLAS
jgi:hypothetical protein